ncbi:MAG: DNA replication/repair protein RecF [Salinarimonadaceae bacterium]|nr:MAG: DNA replication/repair protein RecF [Salinarimonadaceae bacterium]
MTEDAGTSARARVTRLVLQDFRSYPGLSVETDASLVALSGENGAGKTNLLEAISLFTPGRGLRRAELAEMARDACGRFSVFASLRRGLDGEHGLGVGLAGAPGERAMRICRIDGADAGSPAAFAEYLRLVWLTPDLDGLFRGPAGDRRRFLDRLVLAVDAAHGARVNALERATRQRNRLLEDPGADRRWLDAIEREIAEVAIAVAAARRETVERLGGLITRERDDASPFPFAALSLDGEVDALVSGAAAVDAEDSYRRTLRDFRARDAGAGRTLFGPQSSDLRVRHGPKGIAADTASTGEQKALLIGLVLAHARLVRAMTGMAPIVLLDEVAAHLDPRRRAALYSALDALGGQIWMTGADPALFEDLPSGALHLRVEPGAARPVGG